MFNLNKLFFPEVSEVSSKKSKHFNSLKLKKNQSEKEEVYSTPISLNQIEGRDISEEFNFLKKLTKNLTNNKELISGPDYKILNRYSNIVPFKDNLVKLKKGPISVNNYIHANFIKDTSGELKKTFIITQGPKDNTSNHFWKMVENEKSKCIIAIVEEDQLDKKCHSYWPIQQHTETDDYIIITVHEKKTNFICKKKLKVFNKTNNQQFQIDHFHLFNWKDHSIIKKEYFREFFEFLSKLINNKNYEGPLVTHCSAGVGRSGTFVTILYLIEKFIKCKDKNNFQFSVFQTALLVKTQRHKALKSFSQYEFIYEFLLSLKKDL